MPRLSKQHKAAATQKLKQMNQAPKPSGKPYSVKENETEFITPIKSQILDLPFKYIAWIGAKWGGKTRPVVTRMTGMLLEDKDTYGLALKKYKTNAATRLHTAISNMSIEMRTSGYNVPIMAKGISNTYLLRNPRVRDLNQSIEYASLDDMDSIAGIEAPNLGKFGIVHIEEPVMSGDKEQPSPEDFWETIAILESSVDRSNTRYAETHGEEVVSPTYHFTMNAWDDHPLVMEAEEIFPENDFLNGCLGVDDWLKLTPEQINEQWEEIKASLTKNHTAVRTKSADSKAFVRLTMFANPNWAKSPMVYNSKLEKSKELQEEMFWNGIKEAILMKNYRKLAIYLGLKKQKDDGNHTYDLSLADIGDTIKTIKDEGWEVMGSSQGWDIDINRLFVDTPVVLARKQNLSTATWDFKVFVLPQLTFPAFGDGGGINIPIYRDQLAAKSNEAWQTITTLADGRPLQYGRYLYMDDDKSMWLVNFLQDQRWAKAKAKKHGDWEIIPRQDWLNMAINEGFIMFDEKNYTLMQNLKRSTRRDGSKQRDESGSLDKLYDHINSMEYALYPFRGILYSEMVK